MTNAFQYLQENSSESEADYGYTALDGTCEYDSSKGVTKVSTFTEIAQQDVFGILEAVAT